MRTECPDRYRCTVHDKLLPKETICFEGSIAYVTNFCQEIDDLIAHQRNSLTICHQFLSRNCYMVNDTKYFI